MKSINEKYVKNKMELARVKSARKAGQASDLVVMGSGEINRDGVPRLPPEQREVDRWPVLDLGIQPEISREAWSMEVRGLCAKPMVLDFKMLNENFPQTTDTSDFHCVTGWSKFGIRWKGVAFSEIAKVCQISPEAKYVMIFGYDNYSTNVPLAEALKSDVLIAYEADGEPLPKEHGGPVRMITPQLWAWKGAKWISGLEFMAQNKRGFWEERGYSNSAIPWLNDRYTADEQLEES